MIEAYKNYWKQYVDFTGVTSRAGYWWVILMNALIALLLYIIFAIFFAVGAASVISSDVSDGAVAGFGIILLLVSMVSWIWGLANLLPSLAITVRRLRDAGYYWPWIFIVFVPVVGSIVLIVFLSQPSKQAVAMDGQYTQNGYAQQAAPQAPNAFAQGQQAAPQAPNAFGQTQQTPQAPNAFAQGQQAGQAPLGGVAPQAPTNFSEQASSEASFSEAFQTSES